MHGSPFTFDRFRRSTLARVVACLALASNLGCYRSWNQRIAPTPPPSADSVRGPYGDGHTITLLRPEAEGDTVIWGWTKDPEANRGTFIASAAGLDTIPPTDAVRICVPLFEKRQEREGAKTVLFVAGAAAVFGPIIGGIKFAQGWEHRDPVPTSNAWMSEGDPDASEWSPLSATPVVVEGIGWAFRPLAIASRAA